MVNLRELSERHLGVVLGRIDVEILNIRKTGAFVHAHSGDDRNLFLAFLKGGDRGSADSCHRRVGDVHIRNACQIRAVRIHGERYLRTLIPPFIARAFGQRRRAQNVFNLAGNSSKLPDVAALQRGVDISGAGDANLNRIIDRIGQQLPCVQPCSRNGRGENGLQLANKLGSDLFIGNLNQHLRIIQLLKLRRRGKPEPRTSPADKGRDITESRSGLSVILLMLLGKLRGLLPNNLLDFACCIVGCTQVGVIRQPDIDVRPVLDVFRKEGGVQLREKTNARTPGRRGIR